MMTFAVVEPQRQAARFLQMAMVKVRRAAISVIKGQWVLRTQLPPRRRRRPPRRRQAWQPPPSQTTQGTFLPLPALLLLSLHRFPCAQAMMVALQRAA